MATETTTERDPNKEKSDQLGVMLKAAAGIQKIQQADEKHQAKLQQDSDFTALELAHMQEAHSIDSNASAASAAVDLRLSSLKLEKEEQKKELDLAKSVKDGIIPPSTQDPVVPEKPKQVDTFQSSLAKLLDDKANQLKAAGGTQTEDEPLVKYAKEQLLSNLKAIDTGKTLQTSPYGIPGKLIGMVLNILPGRLGTELLGGERSPEQKLELLNKTLYAVSPLIRTQMNEALGDRRLDIMEKVKKGVSHRVASMLGTEEQGASAERTQLDLERKLSNDSELSKVWPASSGVNLSELFFTHKQLLEDVGDIARAGPGTDIEKLGMNVAANRLKWEEMVKNLYKSGMGPEGIASAVQRATTVIQDSGYLDPLKTDSPMSQAMLAESNAQFLTAAEFSQFLHKFEADAIGLAPMEQQVAMFGGTPVEKPKAFNAGVPEMKGWLGKILTEPSLYGASAAEQTAKVWEDAAKAQALAKTGGTVGKGFKIARSAENLGDILKVPAMVETAKKASVSDFKAQLSKGNFDSAQLIAIKRLIQDQDSLSLEKRVAMMRAIDEHVEGVK